MSNLLEVSVLRLAKHLDREMQEMAQLRLSFISKETLDLHLLRRVQRLSILAKVEAELQRISDQRFGSSNIRVKCTSLESGSLEIIVALGMTYKVIKDYPDLRIGVTLFIGDLKKAGKKLHELLFKECRREIQIASRLSSAKEFEQLSESLQEPQPQTTTRCVEVVQPFRRGMDKIEAKPASRIQGLIDAMRETSREAFKVESTRAADERGKPSVRERTALNSLQNRALTLRELAREMGLSVEKSRYLIGRLRVKGLVVEADRSGREKRWRKCQDSLSI